LAIEIFISSGSITSFLGEAAILDGEISAISHFTTDFPAIPVSFPLFKLTPRGTAPLAHLIGQQVGAGQDHAVDGEEVQTADTLMALGFFSWSYYLRY
jgi:hypothetical protein